MICALLPLLGAVAAPPSAMLHRLSESTTTTHAARIRVSATSGVGRMEEDLVLTVHPRLSLEGQVGSLTFSLPWTERLADTSPQQDKRRFGHRFDKKPAIAMAAMIERLSLVGRQANLEVGHDLRLSFGHGVLMDQHRASIDPALPLSGALLTVANSTASAGLSLALDNIAEPQVIGVTLGFSPGSRATQIGPLTLSAELVADTRAPGSAATTAQVLAFSLDASYDVLRRSVWGLQLFAAAATLAHNDGGKVRQPGLGVHVGGRWEAQQHDWGASLQAQLVRSMGPYRPRYFDAAYSIERLHNGIGASSKLEALQGTTRSTGQPSPTTALVDLHLAWRILHARLNLMLTPARNRPLLSGAELEIGIEHPRAALHARGLWRTAVPGDLSSRNGRSNRLLHISVDASLRLYGALFAYSAFHHGYRRGQNNRRRQVSDWTAGLGFSADFLAAQH